MAAETRDKRAIALHCPRVAISLMLTSQCSTFMYVFSLLYQHQFHLPAHAPTHCTCMHAYTHTHTHTHTCTLINTQGPPGIPGLNGTDGETGPKGEKGDPGRSGSPGKEVR